tara:strand:- start:124 stop:348 length:225 start_codon:yes stop_codon:yes gene_type:complete
MNEYKVSVTHTVTVEAEDEQDAEEEAMNKLEEEGSGYTEPDFHVEKIKELDPEPPDSCTLAKEKAEEDMLTGLS